MRRPVEQMEDCERRFGRRFTLRFVGGRSFVFLHEPQDIKAAFAANPDAIVGGRANAAFATFLGRHTLFALDGEEHRRHRRLILPSFRGEALVSYLPIIEGITREAIASWPIASPFMLHEKLRSLAFTLIAKVIFGVYEGARIEAMRGYVHRMSGSVGAALTYLKPLQRDLGPWSPWGRFLRTRRRFFAECQHELDSLRDSGSARDDVLARLIADGRTREDPLSTEELHHELLTLVAAGYETTSTGLAWAFQYLLVDPATLDRAREEALQNPDELRPDKLPYLSAVISESLRLMPPVPIAPRYVAKTVDLAGWSPPVGTYLALCAYLAHRSTDSFPEPARFRPERFLGARLPPWIYFPYGGGARLCVGNNFAHYEMVAMLATILRSVDLVLVGPRVARPVRSRVTIDPEGGTLVRMDRRS